MQALIKPQEVTIKDMDGNDRTYILSRFDFFAGQRIFHQMVAQNLPVVGSYDELEKVSKLILSYVAVPQESGPLRLTTDALVLNHVPDAETGFELQKKMMEYNFDFFRSGKPLAYLALLTEAFQKKVIETLTPSSPR